MNEIKKQKAGVFLKAEKGNEIISRTNPLLNIKVVYDAGITVPEVVYSDRDVTIKIPKGN